METEENFETVQSSEKAIKELEASLEALLFVAPGEVNLSQLAAALDIPVSEVEKGLSSLAEQYSKSGSGRGLRLQYHRGRYQLTTAPQSSAAIERFLGYETTTRLSRAALETLAIVLYQQPVTRPQIDSIRGVSSDAVLHNLLLRDLIQEIGRADKPGRPILYSATSECLQYFGLSSLEELPPLDLNDLEQGQRDEHASIGKGISEKPNSGV